MYVFGNGFNFFWFVLYGVGGGYVCQQCLCGVDVGGGFFVVDVLFVGLYCYLQGGVVVYVFVYVDYVVWYGMFEVFLIGQECCVWFVEVYWYVEVLSVVYYDVGVLFIGRGQQGVGQQVGGDNQGGVLGVGFFGNWCEVQYFVVGVGILYQCFESFFGDGVCVFCLYFEFEVFGVGFYYIYCLWMYVVGYEKDVVVFVFVLVFGQSYCFGGGGGFVQQ